MNIEPAGYYDSSEEGSEYESGFSENSADDQKAIAPHIKLQNAIKDGDLEEIRLISSEIKDYKSFVLDNGLKPLVYAVNLSNAEVLSYFLRYDVENNVGIDAYASYSPVIAACSDNADSFDYKINERVECIQLLLSAGHDINFKDRYGESALMRACKCAPKEVVEVLLKLEANVNDTDNDGWSALFYATSRGDLEIIDLLLEYKADLTKTDKRNRFAYMVALEKGFSELSDLLKPANENAAEVFMMLPSSCSIFDEDDANYYGEVFEMVAATSFTMRTSIPTFVEKKLRLHEFLLLKSEQELRDLGILFSGQRQKLIARIKQFHLGCWFPESFGLNGKNECSQLLSLLNFVATLHRQLYVLTASLEYVKNDTVKLNQEDSLAIGSMLTNAKCELLRLNDRLAALKVHLRSVNKESHPYLTAQEVSDA